MFKVGDMAVYPTQGVGVIEAINNQSVLGQDHRVYVLRIVDTDMRIMVPINNAGTVGLRCPVDKEDVGGVFQVLRSPAKAGKVPSWSRRQRVYQEKIRTGNLLEVADVMRELCQLRNDKELSYGEKKVLEQTQRLLIKELALVSGDDEKQLAEQLNGIFH